MDNPQPSLSGNGVEGSETRNYTYGHIHAYGNGSHERGGE